MPDFPIMLDTPAEDRKGERPAVRVFEEVAKWNALRRQVDDLDIDPICLFDTLDGETDLTGALLLLAEEIAERETMAQAVALRIKELQERKSRIDKATDTLRQIITMAMASADIPTVKGDLCTLSRGSTPGKVEVTEEARIPAEFWKPQDPTLDRKVLLEALNEGRTIEGARLTSGGINLTIRRR